jgi:hypothetical protein
MKLTAESLTPDLAQVTDQLSALHHNEFQSVERIHVDFFSEALAIRRGDAGAPVLRREHLDALYAVVLQLRGACDALNSINEELRAIAEGQCLDAASAIDLLNDIRWGRA